MTKILVALVLGVAILLPAAAAFADEGNWDERAPSASTAMVLAEPINLGTIAGDDAPSYVQFRADQEHLDK